MVRLALAGAERGLIEFFRANYDRFFGILTLAQAISVVLVAMGITGALRLGVRGPGSLQAPGEA